MAIFIYDGSFEGLLCSIFYSYEHRTWPSRIAREGHEQQPLFDSVITINTEDEKARRVLTAIDNKTADKGAELLYALFLSETDAMEMLVLDLVKAIMGSKDGNILSNFADPAVLRARQIEKMMYREVHRMHAFVRFQKSAEGIFYAAIEPDFNVLPLIGDHFERRYADQPWIIVDTRRHYGLHYDLHKTEFVTLDDPVFNLNTGSLMDELRDEHDHIYGALWEQYFQAVNIRERNNPALHLRHIPKRYWKYLPEKNRSYRNHARG